MAAEAEQQLSLVPELALQGSLFAEASGSETASGGKTAAARGGRTKANLAAAEPDSADGISLEALQADAAARPRTRQATASEASSESQAANDSAPSSDEPAWAHHKTNIG